MSLTYGFYDSHNGDRVYNAGQFSSFLDGIIYDGVYNAIGNKFYVEAVGGMNVTVDSGRAWFAHTWTLNTTKYQLTISAADTVYNRIDAVILDINKSTRTNSFKVLKGTASSSPQRPTLTKTTSRIQYALAYVSVKKNVTSIVQSDITYVVDTSETPLVTALALSGIPSGGTIGQVLAKQSSESGSVGWYDIDKLPFDKWYLATGMQESDVIAAYKFINRTSQSVALQAVNQNVDSSNYALSNSLATWNNTDGFTIPAYGFLHNTSVSNRNPVSIVMKITDIASSGNYACILSEVGGDGRTLYARTPYMTGSYVAQYTNKLGFSAKADSNGTLTYRKITEEVANDGVIGVSFTDSSGSLYFNGRNLTIKNISTVDNTYSWPGPPKDSGKLIGMASKTTYSGTTPFNAKEKWNWKPFKIQYVAFYSGSLTFAQYNEIYNNITSDSRS